MNADSGPTDFMARYRRINAIQLSFQISRMTPAMMATMTVSNGRVRDVRQDSTADHST